jgi:hypothetical protein
MATVAAGGALAVPWATAEPAAAEGVGTTYDGFVNDQGGQVFNVTNPAYGATGDTIRADRGASVSAGSTTLTQTTAGGDTSSRAPIAFDPTTDVGKVVTVQGAGPSGGVLSTRIVGVVSASTVTLADAASTSATNAAFAYGTDDTAALLAAIAAAGSTGTVYLPAGIYTILGASNAGAPIRHTGRGGMRGRGGKSVANEDATTQANTVLLCSDATAGLVADGCARYESFRCDGNNVAVAPLQNGTVVGGAVTTTVSHATFVDVWATASAADGWSIFGGRNNAYYDCGTTNNARDGLSIDGGASGMVFFHFRQGGDARYGIHGDDLVTAKSGSRHSTSAIRFFSGVLGRSEGRAAGVSTVYLRNAVDWRFPEVVIDGGNLTGPTVDLDQSKGHGVDLSRCTISASRARSRPARQRPRPRAADSAGLACIQISGTPANAIDVTFLKIDECLLLDGDHSVFVKGSPGSYRYSAVGGWQDTTLSGGAVAAGVPPFDTLFDGRTGAWQAAAVQAPWSGTVSYRVAALGAVDLVQESRRLLD